LGPTPREKTFHFERPPKRYIFLNSRAPL
jgi:hypothetical protein